MVRGKTPRNSGLQNRKPHPSAEEKWGFMNRGIFSPPYFKGRKYTKFAMADKFRMILIYQRVPISGKRFFGVMTSGRAGGSKNSEPLKADGNGRHTESWPSV
jgi:hypothetical protein